MIRSYQVTNFSALGTTVAARLLQEALVIFPLQADVATWSESACKLDAYPNPVPFCSRPYCISRGELEVSRCPDSGFPRGSEGLRSSTNFSLNSWSQSENSCNRSLCTSSRPSSFFLFSVSVGLCIGFPCSSSLVLPLLSGAGFSVYLSTSNTESCDEDVEEIGVGVVEELVDKPGNTNGT